MTTNRDQTTLLKQDVLGRVTLTRARREALLDEFERSGMKGLPFARMAGVRYPTFANWIQKRRRARGDYAQQAAAASTSQPKRTRKAALRLVEVALPPGLPRAELTVTAALELLLPGGARLLLHDARQTELAAHLLRNLNTLHAC
jgi:hypothetical protein